LKLSDEKYSILIAMKFFFVKCAFLLFASVPVFSQSEAGEREQGLLTNEPYWRQALGGAVLSLPDVQVQSAVVALDGGNIKAYSTSGKPMWNYSAKGKISPFVTRSREGTSYISRTNGIFIAVNRAGRELWRRTLDSPLCAKTVPGWDGRLFVPVEKKIFCFTASGNLLWTYTFESRFSLAPKLDSAGGILLALENNNVVRIDPFGNTQNWRLLKKCIALLSAEQQKILALYADGTMEILNQSQSEETNSSILLPKLPLEPLSAVSRGSNIAAVLKDGRLVFVSMSEKKILWYNDSHIREFIKNGGKLDTEVEMLFDERGIYILNKNGASGFSHDGRRLWFTILQNAAAVPAFGDDGVLYSGGKDWILYTYKIEDRILPAKISLYGPLPEGVYGTGSPQPAYITNIQYFEPEIKVKLEQIGAAINAGKVGANELEWITFLMTIIETSSNIQYRVFALNMLGKIGSQETISWLTNIFNKDADPTVKAAAAFAIGEIGVDPDGIAINSFHNSIVHSGGFKDEQVMAAIASSTGALCRFSGPPLSEMGVKILTFLSGDFQPIVRQQAQKELASLK
jgi:outer membrane protein assembly factor BamB